MRTDSHTSTHGESGILESSGRGRAFPIRPTDMRRPVLSVREIQRGRETEKDFRAKKEIEGEL